MKTDTPLDYAVFQLSPKRSRCELIVSSNGITEKLASGLVKPFVTHLKVAEESVARAAHSIKLEAERNQNAQTWFTKGTLERFVRFVSTPEVLEMVNTFDVEMSQLEAARKIYSQGSGDQLSGSSGGDGMGSMTGSDATKKELLRAIDVRLAAVRQDLVTAFGRAAAAGFNPDSIQELQHFSDCFGAGRLNEACTKFLALCQRRSDLVTWKPSVEDQIVRSSWESDMSIDDPGEDTSESNHIRAYQIPSQNNHLFQQPNKQDGPDHIKKPLPSQIKPVQEPNSNIPAKQQANQSKNEDEKKEETDTSLNQPSHPARRLSVQDRINLFENKQKENSGGKPVVAGKSTELRRLSSDVSSEKAVLRRWSGASDMSIDLGNDKDTCNTDSPVCTPSSSALQTKRDVFLVPSGDNNNPKFSSDSVSSIKDESESFTGLKDQNESQSRGGQVVGKDEVVDSKGKVDFKDAVSNQVHLNFSGGEDQTSTCDQAFGEVKLKGNLDLEGDIGGVKNQVALEGKSGFADEADIKNQVGIFSVREGEVESGSRVQDVEGRDQQSSQSQLKGFYAHSRFLSGQFEGTSGMKLKEGSYKDPKGGQSASELQLKQFAGNVEQVGKKDAALPGKGSSKLDDSESQKIKLQKPLSSGPERTRKVQGRREESGSLSEKRASQSRENFDTMQAPSVEQGQRSRQSKVNQELNDELQMKANELEKLFAEHKLRVGGDQPGSTWRTKPTEATIEQAVSSQYIKPTVQEVSPIQFQEKKSLCEPTEGADMTKFSTPPSKGSMVDDQGYSSSLRQHFSELSFSEDSRGKFYENYRQKRDAKLREEWNKNRAEKEAKLKSLQDSLDRSRAEMKAKFFGSSERHDRGSSARRHAEKLKGFNFHSHVNKDQMVNSAQNDEIEDISEFCNQKYHGKDISFSDASLGDSDGKKLLPIRNLSSTTPRTAIAPPPRSKVSASGKRKMQSENPLAQSVPNFSDLRKESMKPSSTLSKTTNRSQLKSYAHSKSTNEETQVPKEDKPKRSQSLRKGTATVEFKDFPSLNSDSSVLAPLKFDKEATLYENAEPKSFLRKGNGVVASVAKLKAGVPFEEPEEFPSGAEDSFQGVKEEEEEREIIDEEGVDFGNSKPRISHESDKMGMSGSEHGDSLRSLSQIDPSSVAELPASVPSAFHTTGSLQESPSESPMSWNMRMHHQFSYPQETSDIDASVDSPIGSPASWNSHSLVHTEADAAARMRRKWGNAQKPTLVSNPSSHNNQSRKDMTKGFKRLLKFGRKSRGTESLVDWISATTSEGDDDAEDGRDPGNRSSEDSRKSRMGFSQAHPCEYGFNENELFGEPVQVLHSSIPAPPVNFKLRDDHISGSSIKAPRSFFSLSTFMSKASESKPR